MHRDININGEARTFLLLGGTGFIGTHLANFLVERGKKVTAFSRHPAIDPVPGVTYVLGHLNDTQAVEAVLRGHDTVVHLISCFNPSASNQNILVDLEANVLPALRLLEICVHSTVKKIVFVSSGGTVYGSSPSVPMLSEAAVPQPEVAYGVSRLTIEHYLHLYRCLYSLNTLTLRVSNAYGPGQRPNTGQGLVATTMDRMLAGDPIELWGDGSAVRDYLFVEDVARAIARSADYKGPYHTFNLGSGVGRSVLSVIDDIEEAVGIGPVRRVHKTSASPGVSRNVLDISLIKKELDWEPHIAWVDGLSATLEWIKTYRAVVGGNKDASRTSRLALGTS